MIIRRFLVPLLLTVAWLPAFCGVKAQVPAAPTPAATIIPSEPTVSPGRITAYTLAPERARQAHDVHRIYFWYSLISFPYVIVILWAMLHGGLAPKYRAFAEHISSRRLVQTVIFTLQLFLTLDLLQLPLGIFRHWLGSSYGLSISSWPVWFWDWTKAELLTIVAATVVIWILYAIVRHSPRRWWIWFWAASLPLGVFLVFLTPLVVDPLFNKFEPLAQKDPALAAELQRLVQRAGEDISAERMFWMGAAEKTTTLNAYVTGLGSSKRIVVWDTTIAKMSRPQIVFVTGHEMGHYVLQHIPKGLAIGAVSLLLAYYLGARTVGWVLARWGAGWRIRGLDDLASLPVLILIFTIFAFLSNPIASAISRHFEHQADQYAIEVTHDLTQDPAQACARAFQVLGDIGLSDPDPLPADVFLFYDHPPARDRVQFCLSYDPWAQGRRGAFVK